MFDLPDQTPKAIFSFQTFEYDSVTMIQKNIFISLNLL